MQQTGWGFQGRQIRPQQPPPRPYNLVNQAAPDPYLQDFHNQWKSRLGELRADEGALRTEHDARTKQMIASARGDISDAAAGAGASLSEDLARRGVAGAGVEAGQRAGLSEASQREQARASTNIALDQNRNYEAQRFARQQALNQFLSGGLASAGAIGQRQLEGQRLGLDQYQVMNQRGDREQEMFKNYFQQKPTYQRGARM